MPAPVGILANPILHIMSTSAPMSQMGGLLKFPRTNHVRIFAENMKPPEPKLVNNVPVYQLRYVSSTHKEIKIPCTEAVYRRALGERSRRRAHTGLDMQIYHRFFLVVDKSTSLVTGIDMYPHRMAMHGLQRADAPTHNCLVLNVNAATGDMTVEDFPGDVTEAHIHGLFARLDPLGEIRTGEDYNGFQVESIAGGRIFLNINHLPDRADMLDEDDIYRPQVPTGSSDNVGSGYGIGFRTPQGGGLPNGPGGVGTGY
jgi:hypothetical protein